MEIVMSRDIYRRLVFKCPRDCSQCLVTEQSDFFERGHELRQKGWPEVKPLQSKSNDRFLVGLPRFNPSNDSGMRRTKMLRPRSSKKARPLHRENKSRASLASFQAASLPCRRKRK